MLNIVDQPTAPVYDLVPANVRVKRFKAREEIGTGYLLSVDSDPKTAKSNKGGEYLTAIMYLSPSRWACPNASKGCLKACLHTAGNPAYLEAKLKSRRKRTEAFRHNRQMFFNILVQELRAFVKKCERLGVKPAVRLNGTSDIAWERVFPQLFTEFSTVTFYDYTKRYDRLGKTPANYDLTLSRSESNQTHVDDALANGYRVAIVFDISRQKLAKQTAGTYNGHKIVNGDVTDLTFSRPNNCVLALSAKGMARKDNTGFVVSEDTIVWGGNA